MSLKWFQRDPNVTPKSKYVLKLVLDSLGPVPGENDELLAAIDSAVVDDSWGDVKRLSKNDEGDADRYIATFSEDELNASDVVMSLDDDNNQAIDQ